MIDYDRTSYWRITLSFVGTVLPHVLGRVGLLTMLSFGLNVLEVRVLEPAGEAMPALDPLGHTVLGMAISMLIVFRTNSSANRYWEARSHWGAMINNSRNLVRIAAIHAGAAHDLARLVAAYVIAVKQNLRGDRDLGELHGLVTGRLFEQATAAGNPPTTIAAAISEWIYHRLVEKRIDPITAMRLEQLVDQLVDAQGGCEKIQATPLPFVYAALIKQLILVYLISLPFVFVRMGWAGPLVMAVVSLGMFGIEEAGVEIENPFAYALNDLPLDRLCAIIQRDTNMLGERGA